MNLFYYVCTDDYIQDRQGTASWAQCQITFERERKALLRGVGDSLTWTGTSNCDNGTESIQFIVLRVLRCQDCTLYSGITLIAKL